MYRTIIEGNIMTLNEFIKSKKDCLKQEKELLDRFYEYKSKSIAPNYPSNKGLHSWNFELHCFSVDIDKLKN